MVRFFLIGLTALVALGVAGFFALQANALRLMEGQVEQSVTRALEAQNIPSDSFEVLFCGTGSPQFQPDRNQPCHAVIVGGRLFVFDAGQGAAQNLQAVNAPLLMLETVFLTHLHSDHMSGLGDVLHNSGLYGRKTEVEVIGPPGTESLLEGVQKSFAADLAERQDIIGDEYNAQQIDMGRARDVTIEGTELVEVYARDGIVVSAFQVDHPNWQHAYGYRVDYRGKSIVISGDTRYAPNLVTHAQGVDVLIHEAVNVDMMQVIAGVLRKHGGPVDPDRMALITTTHTPTADLAKIAVETGTAHLVLTHLIPPIPANTLAEQAFIDGMDQIYDGKITVARDGLRITLAE